LSCAKRRKPSGYVWNFQVDGEGIVTYRRSTNGLSKIHIS
jgi:hypothetical protein